MDEWLDLPDLVDKVQELLELGLYDDVGKLLNRFDHIYSDDWEFHYLFSRYYSEQNKPQSALPYLHKGLNLDRKNPDCLIGLFYAYAQLNKLRRGAKYLTLAQGYYPDSEMVISAVIWYNIEISKFEEAIAWFQKVRLSPNPEIFRNAGIAYERLGYYSEAEECFKHALDLSPSYEEVQDLLADHYIFLGQIDSSIKLYQELLKKSPRNIRILSRLVYCYSQNDETDKAVSEAIQITILYPNSPVGYVDLAYVHLNNDDVDKCLAAAKKALDVSPLDVEAFRVKAIAHSEKDEPEQAREAFSTALALDPENPEIMRDYYHHLRDTGNYEEMEKMVDAVILLEEPYCMEDYWFLADYYKDQNQDQRSFHFLNKAYKSMPGEKELLPAMADILLGRGHVTFSIPFLMDYVAKSGWNNTMNYFARHKRLRGYGQQEGLRFLRYYGQHTVEFRRYIFSYYIQKFGAIILLALAVPIGCAAWLFAGTAGTIVTTAAYVIIFGVWLGIRFIKQKKSEELENSEPFLNEEEG